MGQGGQEGRLARVHASARVRDLTPQVGGGTYVFVAFAEPSHEQGLREALRQRGGVRLRGYDPCDGEAPGPCLRISKQFRKVNSANFVGTAFSRKFAFAKKGAINTANE